jgi:hypothetical protein
VVGEVPELPLPSDQESGMDVNMDVDVEDGGIGTPIADSRDRIHDDRHADVLDQCSMQSWRGILSLRIPSINWSTRLESMEGYLSVCLFMRGWGWMRTGTSQLHIVFSLLRLRPFYFVLNADADVNATPFSRLYTRYRH